MINTLCYKCKQVTKWYQAITLQRNLKKSSFVLSTSNWGDDPSFVVQIKTRTKSFTLTAIAQCQHGGVITKLFVVLVLVLYLRKEKEVPVLQRSYRGRAVFLYMITGEVLRWCRAYDRWELHPEMLHQATGKCLCSDRTRSRECFSIGSFLCFCTVLFAS